MTAKQTQRKRIIEYMQKYGKITPMDAWDAIGCTKLSTRVGELKHEGYRIVGMWTNGINRDGQATRYKTYHLMEG